MIKSPKVQKFHTKKERKDSNDQRKEPPLRQSDENHSRKNKSSIMKLKDQMIHQIEKVQVPKKFVNFVKKNAKLLPDLLTKEEGRMLLPKLQEISFISKQAPKKQKNDEKFKELESKLSSSLVEFVHETENEKVDLWAIQIQTQKCYKHIPAIYFESVLKQDDLRQKLKLTKNPVEMREIIFELQDYADEVEFNINQQVSAKMKIFMKFVLCMNNITELVNINLEKIHATRKYNNILRNIVVSKSIMINDKRVRKQNIAKTIKLLQKLKKLKSIQAKLMNQMALGNIINPDGKNRIGIMYTDYCELHNSQLKKYCCSSGKPVCKYWDVSYYVERGYQQNFIKIIKIYFFQIIQADKDIESYKRAQGINKKNFMTTPANFSPFSNLELDSSYEIDFDVEITIKENIEKEILSVFEQGMEKYSYSTEEICEQLKNHLNKYKCNLLEKLFDDLQNSSEKTSSLKNILSTEKEKELTDEFIQKGLKKFPWVKYEKILDIIVNRMEQICKRVLSLIDKILIIVANIEEDQPQRCQVVSVYMMQLIFISVSFVDNLMELVIKPKTDHNKENSTKSAYKSRGENDKYQEFEAEKMKKLINICKRCESQFETFRKYHPLVKRYYDIIVNQNEDFDQNEKQNERKWIPKILNLKSEIVKSTYQNMHKSIIAKELKQKLQDDNWQPIKISYDVYECIGYIIGGRTFMKEEERKQKQMLSSSLLLERQLSDSGYSTTYNKTVYSSRFKVNHCFVTLDDKQYRLTSSTEEMVKFLHHYLELYDEIPIEGIQFDEKKFQLHGKVTQLILMYNQYVKDLILKSEALKFNKIKSKSITARHLLVTFVQLKIIDLMYCGKILQERIKISVEECSVMHGKLSQTMKEIQKKFRKILHERIQTTIKEIKIKDENLLETEPFLAVIKNINSSVQLFKEILYDESTYQGFMDIIPQESSWVQSLVSRVNKGSKGKQTKVKCFQYLVNELEDNMKYLPNLKMAIESMLH